MQPQRHPAAEHDVAGRATKGRARMLVATRPVRDAAEQFDGAGFLAGHAPTVSGALGRGKSPRPLAGRDAGPEVCAGRAGQGKGAQWLFSAWIRATYAAACERRSMPSLESSEET